MKGRSFRASRGREETEFRQGLRVENVTTNRLLSLIINESAKLPRFARAGGNWIQTRINPYPPIYGISRRSRKCCNHRSTENSVVKLAARMTSCKWLLYNTVNSDLLSHSAVRVCRCIQRYSVIYRSLESYKFIRYNSQLFHIFRHRSLRYQGDYECTLISPRCIWDIL